MAGSAEFEPVTTAGGWRSTRLSFGSLLVCVFCSRGDAVIASSMGIDKMDVYPFAYVGRRCRPTVI